MALGSAKKDREYRGPFEAKDERPTRHHSKAHEKEIAATLGGRVKPNSGATAYSKGDVVVKRLALLFEAKTTAAGSYRVPWAELAKITREAMGEGKDPAFDIQFRDTPQDDRLTEKRWIMVPASVFQRLTGSES
ncbi:hypothetical protein UFOVP1382_191 [uncultured Caudovirales phage]|uniref:Uncharacterized protein n=1 Tax=uncultured Caudovirales phage TaxID=2100421 RepID=A0A6J5S5E1_9CAUD|nr:hypothetical protein UFOVP1382_191 [uncultured Caudovirales phage]